MDGGETLPVCGRRYMGALVLTAQFFCKPMTALKKSLLIFRKITYLVSKISN